MPSPGERILHSSGSANYRSLVGGKTSLVERAWEESILKEKEGNQKTVVF